YIAQPPLYKVKRGKTEQYLKDDRALEQYLLQMALENLSFKSAAGAAVSGEALVALVKQAGTVVKQIDALNRTVNDRLVIEQSAIGNLFDPSLEAGARAAKLAERLKVTTGEDWQGESHTKGHVLLTRSVEGLVERRGLHAS